MSEMIHIKGQIHGINAQDDTELLDDTYIDIIKQLVLLPPLDHDNKSI